MREGCRKWPGILREGEELKVGLSTTVFLSHFDNIYSNPIRIKWNGMISSQTNRIKKVSATFANFNNSIVSHFGLISWTQFSSVEQFSSKISCPTTNSFLILFTLCKQNIIEEISKTYFWQKLNTNYKSMKDHL